MKSTKTLKDASQVFCPNLDCPARGKIGAGNLVSHGKERERYKCKMCKKTFGIHQGTMFEGLRNPEELIVIVVTLLAYGCPAQAIVHALRLDERTMERLARASWSPLPKSSPRPDCASQTGSATRPGR